MSNEEKKKAVFHWSGGKDSAHALYRVLQAQEYEVVALLTTVNADTSLSTMHNIPPTLLDRQSACIGIPLYVVRLRSQGGMDDYGIAMKEAALHFKSEGVTHFIFGDICLHDIRSYREQLFTPLGIEVVEPLWEASATEVMEAYLQTGLKAVIVSTMADGLAEDAIGRELDASFIRDLPTGYDLNGENGEYHSFCYDGPIFATPVRFTMSKPFRKSYDIALEDGTVKTFTYCFCTLGLPE